MKTLLKMLQRSLLEGLRHIFRNGFLSFTTIVLSAILVFLLNILFATRFYADIALKQLESRADFSLYIQQDYNAFNLDALINDLKQYDISTTVEQATTWQGIDIPPLMILHFSDLTKTEEAFSTLAKVRYDNVVTPWDQAEERSFVTVIKQLIQARDAGEKLSFWLTIIFIVGGFFITTNIFQLVFFARKDEIEIGRLVGASRSFLLGPFLAEGALLGFIGSTSATIITIILLTQINGLPTGEIFIQLWDSVFFLQIFVSSLIGGFGAYFASTKYIH